ncbi:2-oxo-4-hydroxy-4-carboxy-5-ureidoimidazoline decarboxylase [Limibaculum sp. M0105]|uniref:2-oxo-4-hydroxy-4-carboxy-5-ureidoimidazoline decarboxylase n=1 Tax=Thermohalobaculum xanthum TaxID=2753746 RepID=A0A8J7M6I6_9RHOB|nr:2-oxo-4-hydroxy-4-carboxy-5-ureidoimidazoline decarboxylase [Thermohalobaculum xanthum]MBK0398767.1 2-oxo-4-hydroxy-4-carboxy-5-ureidoimidazoline decarboxylase [Thermohalobaculum xanthum]
MARATFRTMPPSALDRAGFLARYGGVYEESPWIAAAVWDAGHATDEVARLAEAMAAVVDGAPRARQLELLRAHPDLAGRLAMSGGLTAASTSEQAGAGLDQCSPAEFDEFTRLNGAYTARFGFPFIVAVRGLDRQAILERFRARFGNPPEDEFREALAQVHRIARLRLEALAQARV